MVMMVKEVTVRAAVMVAVVVMITELGPILVCLIESPLPITLRVQNSSVLILLEG